MTVITDSERRAGYVKVMGPALGDLHHDIENEAAVLLRKWDDFDELFNDDAQQLELLNRVASNFFYFLQQRWYEDALLHISRLTDPPESGGRRQVNLTIRRLPDNISDPTLRATVETAVARALDRSHFARVWRDRRVAHSDLMFSGQNSVAGLPAATRAGVREAIEAICEPTHLISTHFGQSVALASARDPWGVRSLLAHLRRSVRDRA
jgi:hypothetical protein